MHIQGLALTEELKIAKPKRKTLRGKSAPKHRRKMKSSSKDAKAR